MAKKKKKKGMKDPARNQSPLNFNGPFPLVLLKFV
jgi:hypothetical protein